MNKTQDDIALDLIASGLTVSDVAKALGETANTLRARLARNPLYARAREAQCHAMAERCREIADSSTAQTERVDRLRIDTLKWLVSKLLPSTYGDRAGEGTQAVRLEVVVRRELPDALYGPAPMLITGVAETQGTDDVPLDENAQP